MLIEGIEKMVTDGICWECELEMIVIRTTSSPEMNLTCRRCKTWWWPPILTSLGEEDVNGDDTTGTGDSVSALGVHAVSQL
jgi:hypothetical protein